MLKATLPVNIGAMSVMTVTNNGISSFNSLVNNPNYIFHISSVKFSNVQQNSATLPSQTDLVGDLAEGIILTRFYSKDVNDKLNFLTFLPRKAFPNPNYVVRAIGLYDNNNKLIAAGNVSPSGFLVGVIVKASINLNIFGVTKAHKTRIRVNTFYHLNFDRIVLNQVAGVGDESCPFENYLYHFFEIHANGKHISKGIYTRAGQNKYRILINPNTYLLYGEY